MEAFSVLREYFTNEELERMGLGYIAVLHEPIVDSDGSPDVLGIRRGDDSWVHASYDRSDFQWGGGGAFPFLAS